MSDLYPTRNRVKLLVAAAHGRIVIANDITMWRSDGGWNRRCDAMAREAEAAGWLALGADGCTYELTETGRALVVRERGEPA